MGDKPSDNAAEGQLVKKQLNYAEIEQISKAFVASKMFGNDMERVSQAITKIMAGQELGLAPFASMRAVHVIDGNATLSANTMAGMVKSSGRYDYEVVKKEVDKCVIDFYEIRKGKRVKLGTETFDAEEAKAAGLSNKNNWQKYPKAMMFARCISNGVRTYCPDVFSGMLVYTPDELNANVNADGDVIDMDKDGNITNIQKKATPKADKETPEAETDVAHEDDKAEEITEEEIEASGNAAAVEPEEEPEIEVTEDLKKQTLEHIDTLKLKPNARLRLLKEATGHVSPNQIKKDEEWRELHKRVMAVLNGEEELPADWLNETDEPDQKSLIDEEDQK